MHSGQSIWVFYVITCGTHNHHALKSQGENTTGYLKVGFLTDKNLQTENSI
jgi:hypothetical protein